MTEKGKNKRIQDIIKEWKKEADRIKEPSKQPKGGALLDNGCTGKYYELAQKYQKIINDIRNS